MLLNAGRLRPEIHALLSWLVNFEREWGRPAFVSDVAYRGGIAVKTARYRLDRLAEQKLVDIDGKGCHRRAVLTEDGYQAQATGCHPAPVPYFATGAHAGDMSGVPTARLINCLADLFSVLKEPNSCYFLPLRGDCMDGGRRPVASGAEILFYRCAPGLRPNNGEMVHIEVDLPGGETEGLLREYFFNSENGRVTLRARNKSYEDIHRNESEVRVRGLARKVIQDATTGETTPEFGLPMTFDYAKEAV